MDEVTQAPEAVEVADQPDATVAEPTVEEVESFTDIDPAEAPEGDLTQEWLQERYKQMQGDYTRKRQADAQTAQERAEELEFLEALRSDPDTQRAVFEQLQEILAESDVSETDDDPAADLAAQVAELREAEESRQANALTQSILQHVEQLAKDASLELDDDDLRDIFERATAGDTVNQDVTADAFKAWHEREQAKQAKWQKNYLASKQAPAQVPSGQSATETPDLSSHEERVKRMAARMQAASVD